MLADQDICLLMIETSSNTCSVAYSIGAKVVEEKMIFSEKAEHTSILPPLVDEIMATLRADKQDLHAVVVSAGPGSYTGLRIGSSFAKGLAHGLSVPLIAISSLDLLVAGYRKEHLALIDENALLIPMIDARRMEVYTALYNGEASLVEEQTAEILSAESFAFPDYQERALHFFGSGAKKVEGLWAELGLNIVQIAGNFPLKASYMLELALARYEAQDFEDLAYWCPNYLKDYVAKVAKNKVLGI